MSSGNSPSKEKDISGSSNNLLEVRPLSDLPGQVMFPTSEEQNQTLLLSPSQSQRTLRLEGSIFSPQDKSHDSDDDLPNVSSSQAIISHCSEGNRRRSRRLRGLHLPELAPLPSQIRNGKKAPKKGGKIKKAKSTKQKTAAVQESHGDPVRCCICMQWLNASDEEVYGGTIWTCQLCRTMPNEIREMRKELAAFQQNNMDLVSSLVAQIAENDTLRKENAELKKIINTHPCPDPPSNDNHLVVTDATLNINAQSTTKCEVKAKKNVSLADCKKILAECSKSQFGKVTIAVGSADCAGTKPIDDLSNDIKQLVLQAKTISNGGSVQFSSVVPCLNSQHTQGRIEQLNSAIEDICKTLGATYISNDPSFRLGDGDINEGFYEADRTSLNQAGTSKLLRNLHLEHLLINRPTSADNWLKVSRRKAVKATGPAKRAPCWNCGESNHTSNICRHKKRLTCTKCSKQGHKSSKCPNL